MFVMSLSIFITLEVKTLDFMGIFYFGILISLIGLGFETVADLQLRNFLKLKTGGIMKTGLWSLSRHPNYFGEICFWFGIFLASIPFFNLISIIPFLLISFLILKVSGIPMLEKQYEGNLEFENYKKVTPAFFPYKF